MCATGFWAKVRDSTIEIPAQYRDKVKEMVRVIILAELSGAKRLGICCRLVKSLNTGCRSLSRQASSHGTGKG